MPRTWRSVELYRDTGGTLSGHTLSHWQRVIPGRRIYKSQTMEWTDDSTQEGVDLTCGYSLLPHHLALCAPRLSVRGRPLLGSELRTSTEGSQGRFTGGHILLSSHISIDVGDGGLLTKKGKTRTRMAFLSDIA